MSPASCMISSSPADLQTIISPRAQNPGKLRGYLGRFGRAIQIHQRSPPAIILLERPRLRFVGLQALGDHLFAIVGALDELAAVGIAAPRHLGRTLVHIVNLAAQLT